MYSGFLPRLKGAYRGFTYSVLFSLTGLIAELIVFIKWSSIILLTDIIHWTVDCILEIFALIAIYYAVRISKRFPWGVLVFESIVMLLSITIALGIYSVVFVNYIFLQYSGGQVTTTSIASIVGTVVGGLFTLLILLIQRRNYSRYRLEVLKIDYFHAFIDLIASIVSTTGILLVYYTGSSNIELLFVFVSMLFIIHSLSELVKDIVKTITGSNVDHGFSMKLFKKLVENYSDINVNNVVARKIGSFYAVEVKLNVDPDMKLSTVHRLRNKVIRDIYRESDLVYHVDVKIYPTTRRDRRKTRY